MPLPNFIILGAEKTGSTSLARYVGQHPQVFMPRWSGAAYFSCGDLDLSGRVGYAPREYAMTWAAYGRLFEDAPADRLVGESTPSYLAYERAAVRIAERLPDVKLIAVLRQPADRAYSHFLFNLKKANEPLDDFGAALDAEPGRIASGWHHRYHYRRNGRYSRRLRPYLERFPADRVAVLLYDDFRADPAAFLRRVYRFLDLDEAFVPDTSVSYNVSGAPRGSWAKAMLAAIRPVRRTLERHLPPPLVSAIGRMMLTRPALDPDLRQQLTQEYREDIRRLEEMLDRDLSGWLAAPATPVGSGVGNTD